MTFQGHVKNGVVLLDDDITLPEGAEVRVEVVLKRASTTSSEGPAVRGHDAFLGGYAPQDEGLYDDDAGR